MKPRRGTPSRPTLVRDLFMYKEKRICVVVPAFNEEVQIVKVLETMPPWVDRIVVVDDASTDNTAAIVTSWQEKDARMLLLRHRVNGGVGDAIATGYKWARDNDMDIAVVMAGDAQMDPKDLPAILDPVADGAVDYTKSNRLFSGNAYQKIPRVRFIGNSILSLLTKIASGYWHISDSQSGYTAINRRALLQIDWDRMFKRYGQPNDLLVRLNVYDFKVRDVITEPVYNVGERSKMKIPKVVIHISRLLVRMFLWRMKEKYLIRDFHPLLIFYAFGALLLLIDLGFVVRFFYLYFTMGQAPEITLLICMFLFIMGMQFCMFAMWLDMERNKDLK